MVRASCHCEVCDVALILAFSHPNIVSAIGYSKDDPSDAFIVDAGACTLASDSEVRAV